MNRSVFIVATPEPSSLARPDPGTAYLLDDHPRAHGTAGLRRLRESAVRPGKAINPGDILIEKAPHRDR